MIPRSLFSRVFLCGALTLALPMGVVATEYEVDTTPAGDKLWSAPSTWTSDAPDTVPTGATDKVTFGHGADDTTTLQINLGSVQFSRLSVTGNTSNSRVISGYGALNSTLKVTAIDYTGQGVFRFNNGSNTARLSVETDTLLVDGSSSTILEIGHNNSSASLSLESFAVNGSTTISGTNARIYFNSIKGRAAGENILKLGALNLSGRLVLGGRGNTGGVVVVSSLSSTATTGRLYVYQDSTHNGTSGTLEIQSAPDTRSSYLGVLRDHISEDAAEGVSLTVRKLGSGVQIFGKSDGNPYSGGTEIQGGVLAVTNGSGSGLGTGKVTVSGNGVLAGSGRLELKAQTVEIESGGTLAPSAHLENDVATLTISGAQTPGGALLTLHEGATLSFRWKETGVHDTIAFTGWHENGLALAEEGIIINAENVAEGRFDLFTFDTIANSELSLLTDQLRAQTLGSGFDDWQVTFGYTEGVHAIWLEVQAIPEPGTTAFLLLGLGMAGMAALPRRG